MQEEKILVNAVPGISLKCLQLVEEQCSTKVQKLEILFLKSSDNDSCSTLNIWRV